jgi:DNA-directed RNA polymerase subunit RPC12/RpoP
MPIVVHCANCGKNLRVRDEQAGKRGKCPHCGSKIVVPAAALAIPVDQPLPEPAVPAEEEQTPASLAVPLLSPATPLGLTWPWLVATAGSLVIISLVAALMLFDIKRLYLPSERGGTAPGTPAEVKKLEGNQ